MKVTTTWGNLTPPKPGETLPVWLVRWEYRGRQVRKFYRQADADSWADGLRRNPAHENVTIEAKREPR